MPSLIHIINLTVMSKVKFSKLYIYIYIIMTIMLLVPTAGAHFPSNTILVYITELLKTVDLISTKLYIIDSKYSQ